MKIKTLLYNQRQLTSRNYILNTTNNQSDNQQKTLTHQETFQDIQHIHSSGKMKNNYVNKILPLTLKELRQAEKELRARKNQVFNNANYELIECVARIVKISGMDVKITDQSDVMDFVLFKDPLRDAVVLTVGAHFKFSFLPKRSLLKGGNVDGFAFEINNMKRVGGNQLTAHLANCLCEKLGRQKFKQELPLDTEIHSNGQLKQQFYHPQKGQALYKQQVQNSTLPLNNHQQSKTSKFAQMQQQITKYCRQLGTQFDKQTIWSHFESRFQLSQIQKILEILSDKGEIMDLGLVYEWVGEH